MRSIIGQSIGRYHILEQLGEGGMAVVYKAYDTRLENEVAVKVIRTERFSPEVLARALKRFEREAKALARLTHPNIVKVIDYGEFENRPYLVMPLLPGGNLKERLKETGAMPWQEAIRLLIPIARALQYAHEQNVIHRDIKPSNIMLTGSGQPMLTDFGVAKVLEEGVTLDLTGTAAAVGTPEYMAPEQVTSKTMDHRADIYSLGVVFYEMVAGRKPYEADTPLAVLLKHASDPLPRPRNYAPNLPSAVEQILLKALAKKPEDRYQSMEEMALALEGSLEESHFKPSSEKKRKFVVKPPPDESAPGKPAPWRRKSIVFVTRFFMIGLAGIALLVGTKLLLNRFTITMVGVTITDTPTETATATYTRTSPLAFAPGDEYIISGGPDPDDKIFVDNILRVFVNGGLVAEVSQGGHCCSPVPPIRFIAETGDILRVQAQDLDVCYSLDELWLQKANGSHRSQLTRDIFGNCGSEVLPKQIFFDQTFTLP